MAEGNVKVWGLGSHWGVPASSDVKGRDIKRRVMMTSGIERGLADDEDPPEHRGCMGRIWGGVWEKVGVQRME